MGTFMYFYPRGASFNDGMRLQSDDCPPKIEKSWPSKGPLPA